MKKLVFLFGFLFALSGATYSHAQEALTEDDFTAGSQVILDNNPESYKEKSDKEKLSKDTEVTIVEDKYAGQYVKPSVQNISKLYWKKNALVLSNDVAIDNYMLINECDIYSKFFKDDFEWMRVREAGRQMISENREEFSDKFKMIVPIDLGRYDTKRQGFPLINKTAFIDLRRVEIGGNANNANVCNKMGRIEHYPKNLILILNKPFSYDFVEVDEHIAQAFIIRQKYDSIDRPRNLLNKDYERLAFARIRITFSEYQGETKGRDNTPLGIMFGRLDGIDIFEDQHEKRMITSVDFN